MLILGAISIINEVKNKNTDKKLMNSPRKKEREKERRNELETITSREKRENRRRP